MTATSQMPASAAVASAPTTQVASLATPTAAPAFGTAAPMSGASSVGLMLMSLLLILGLILALAGLLRRMQGLKTGVSGVLKLREGLQLGTKERLVWVQAGETHLLLGVTATQVNTLHVFSREPENLMPSSDFSALLRGLMNRNQPEVERR